MSPEQLLQFNKMQEDLLQLQDTVYRNNYPDEQVFEKKVSCRDTLSIKKTIKFPNGIEIASGSATSDATIKAEMGYTPTSGSIYFGTSPTQPLFMLITSTWTLMNVP